MATPLAKGGGERQEPGLIPRAKAAIRLSVRKAGSGGCSKGDSWGVKAPTLVHKGAALYLR